MSKRKRLEPEIVEEITDASSNMGFGNNDREVGDRKRQKGGPSNSLFVHGLPREITSERLADIFSRDFPIKHAFVVTDTISLQSKGYGFVTFADSSDAKQALQGLNGSLVAGRQIRIEFADHRERISVEQRDTARNLCPSSRNLRQAQEVSPQPTKLIIRNLPWTIRDAGQLSSLFQNFGKIKQVHLPKSKAGLSPGFGFVMLRGRKNAERALQMMNGKKLDGRVLAVDWAIPKSSWQAPTAPGFDARGHAPPTGPEPHALVSDRKTIDVSVDDEPEAEFANDHDADSTCEPFGLSRSTRHQRQNLHCIENVPSNLATLFIRNVPFATTDDTIYAHFSHFGKLRYARIVRDGVDGRSKGTAFVCFQASSDAWECLKNAPQILPGPEGHKPGSTLGSIGAPRNPVLENIGTDFTGLYTLDGRVLHVTSAVKGEQAVQLAKSKTAAREQQALDKRCLFLLAEGTISRDEPLYDRMTISERRIREESLKQRQALVKANPGLHISLRRLSLRSLPRSMTSKELKALARRAVVGFLADVRMGQRNHLSKEEFRRGGDDDKEAQKARRAKGKGIVKQAKVIFESREGSKVGEKSNAGQSRGYGFVEYYSHTCALMGLRWMNGHAVSEFAASAEDEETTKPRLQEWKNRLIVEFAIENAQVVNRRQAHERKAKARLKTQAIPMEPPEQRSMFQTKETYENKSLAQKQRIIGRKRVQRSARKRRA